MEWTSPIKPPFGVPLNRSHWAAQGLVAHYNFSEGCGNLVHDSCGMNDGKMTSMAPFSGTSGWVPGPMGTALAFDGVDDYVLVLNALPLAVFLDMTILAWICPASLPQRAILSKTYNNEFDVISETTGAVTLYQGDGAFEWKTVLPAGSLVVGRLSNVAITRTVSNKRVYGYLDGRLVGVPTAYTKTVSVSNFPVTIGSRITGVAPFNGLISSVSIYNRALSAEEIAYLYAFPWCMYEDVQYRHKVSLCKYAA